MRTLSNSEYPDVLSQNISFVDHLCYLCLVFVMLSRLFIAVLWSPEGPDNIVFLSLKIVFV